MKLFKKKEQIVPVEIPHQHTWKDMPWYMNVRFNGVQETAGYEIIEPYICITCGERKNIKLESEDYSGITAEERKKLFHSIQNRYKKYLKPRAVVEDMINNILMVKDPGYLDMVETMRGTPHRGCGTSADMKKENTHFRIELNHRMGE